MNNIIVYLSVYFSFYFTRTLLARNGTKNAQKNQDMCTMKEITNHTIPLLKLLYYIFLIFCIAKNFWKIHSGDCQNTMSEVLLLILQKCLTFL